MKWVCVILLFLFSVSAYPKDKARTVPVINGDSLLNYPHYLIEGWLFSPTDDTAYARPSFDDSNWKEKESTLYPVYADSVHLFEGLGWLRYHFIADSSITGGPVAMGITHMGASQIYLDGKLIRSFGTIGDAKSSVYLDPQEVPFIFTIPSPGEHLLAVRYANFNTRKNYKIHKYNMAGFRMIIGDVDNMIHHRDLKNIAVSVLMLLAGIFIALTFLHLFIYLYNRAERSNLYFSIFLFCLAMGFIISFISYATTRPAVQLITLYPINALFCIGCIALSGFINELFLKKKTRFYIIATCGVIIMILRFLNVSVFGYATIALVISVSFEAVFTIIFGIIKRVKGARIIGAGMLFFFLFILTVLTISIVTFGHFDVDDRTTEGRVFVSLLFLSILCIPFSMSMYQAWRFGRINKDLALQLDQVKILSQKSLEQEQEKQQILENQKDKLEEEVQSRTAELQLEKKKSDDLLLNILPSEIAEEIKQQGRSQAKTFSMVTVMFTDFVDFTAVSERVSGELLVAEIDYCFSAFDRIIQTHNIEKIKTVGDAYLCAGGLPILTFTHAEDIVKSAIEILGFMMQRKKEKEMRGEIPFEIRIGIHTGPVVAGIVGVKKFAYDIWGDTVNIASRMESSCEAGKINISGSTYELVRDKFRCIHRGKMEAKNKGMIDMYFVEA